MKYWMLCLATTLFCTGCSDYVVRDHNVYKSEVQFTDKLVRAGAASVAALWDGKCGCVDGEWRSVHLSISDGKCGLAADIYLIVKGDRWGWHSSMALLNAGWDLEEIDAPEGFDPESAPEIPPTKSLCE